MHERTTDRQPFFNQHGGPPQYYDPENQEYQDDFDKISTSVRHGFIRKVYGILFGQLLMTTAIGWVFVASQVLRTFVVHHSWFMIVTAVITIVPMLVLLCVPNMSQHVPWNYILLGTFTLFESLTVGATCGLYAEVYSSMLILKAVGATVVIAGGLTLFAFQTKWDITKAAGYMWVAALALLIFGLLSFVSPIMQAIYCGLGALIMGFYLLVDTQLLIGRGKVKISEDDYIFAALSLYVDIINLFMYLLQLFSATEER